MGFFDKFRTKKSVTDNMYLYNDQELDLYESYIMKEFGHYDEVIHEIVSPDIHLDIIVVPPTEENNYYKLITMGMGAYRMNIPEELEEYELDRAELVMFLPPTWNIKSEKEEDYWPIRQLKIVARLPIQCNTWLGYGHTIASDEEYTPYAMNTQFCCMLLLNALNNNYDNLNLKMNTKGKINFYQLVPIYKEELEFKQCNDLNKLLELFNDENLNPVININRINYCENIIKYYQLPLNWQISLPFDWKKEQVDGTYQFMFYHDNSDITIRVTPFHADKNGILAPIEVMENAFRKSIPNSAKLCHMPLKKPDNYSIAIFEDERIEEEKRVYVFYIGYYSKGDLLSVSVWGTNKEECKKTLRIFEMNKL